MLYSISAFLMLMLALALVVAIVSARPPTQMPVGNPMQLSEGDLPFCDENGQQVFHGEEICKIWTKRHAYANVEDYDQDILQDIATETPLCKCRAPLDCFFKGINANHTVMYHTCQIYEEERTCDVRNATDYCEIRSPNNKIKPLDFPCLCPRPTHLCSNEIYMNDGIYRTCQELVTVEDDGEQTD